MHTLEANIVEIHTELGSVNTFLFQGRESKGGVHWNVFEMKTINVNDTIELLMLLYVKVQLHAHGWNFCSYN